MKAAEVNSIFPKLSDLLLHLLGNQVEWIVAKMLILQIEIITRIIMLQKRFSL